MKKREDLAAADRFPVLYGGGGGYPTVVCHSSPSGTVQFPWHPQAQSVLAIISLIASMKVVTGHRPSCCSGQPFMDVSGTTPSLTMMRICGSFAPSQSITVRNEYEWDRDCQYGHNTRWKCTFVAKGAKCETLNDLCSGMWSAGREPSAAKFVRFKAVRTVDVNVINFTNSWQL